MKNDSFCQLCVSAQSLLLLLFCMGCVSKIEKHTSSMSYENRSSIDKASVKTLVLVVLGRQPSPFSFRVEKHEVGADVDRLVEYLKRENIKDAIFESEYKLTEERVAELQALFASANVRLHEFWVPISSRPGRVDLLKLANQKAVSPQH